MAGERPAARLTDMHICPAFNGPVPHVGGPIIAPCCPTVLIGGLPAARVSDMATCVSPPDVIVKGSATVFIAGLPAARIGDSTAHGGVIIVGCPTVLIGDAADSVTSAGAPPPPAAGGPQPSQPGSQTTSQLAESLVTTGGSGTSDDAKLVAKELSKFPKSISFTHEK
jgi:uncharacterized Zn-binding protein involved in type VI secretion